VTPEAKLSVSLLGIKVYRQDISRRETWRGNRLVDFHGVTTEDGKTLALDGKAEGDHFVMMTPKGKTNAPADVRIANPWSRKAVEGDMMFTPDQGRLEMITVGTMEKTTLNVGQRQVLAEHVQVVRSGGAGRYELWFDANSVPVQFSVVGDDTITFTLAG
jgi:hypothetical protein